MKSLFSRLHDSQPGPSKPSAKDSYKFWLPQPRNEPEVQRHQVPERVEAAFEPSSSRKTSDKHSSSRSRRPSTALDGNASDYPTAPLANQSIYPYPFLSSVTPSHTYPRSSSRTQTSRLPEFSSQTDRILRAEPSTAHTNRGVERTHPGDDIKTPARGTSPFLPKDHNQRGYHSDYPPRRNDRIRGQRPSEEVQQERENGRERERDVRERDKERAKERDAGRLLEKMEREREKERERYKRERDRERRDRERQQEIEREKIRELEREQEKERREKERQQEIERQKLRELERERERERREREKELERENEKRERDLAREKERLRERERRDRERERRDRELERQKERERERREKESELERQKDMEREKERERLRKEKDLQLEHQKEMERERERREMEMEMERERERKQKEKDLEKERERRERDLEKQREREEERERQRRETELQLERQKEMERDKDRERRRMEKQLEIEQEMEKEQRRREQGREKERREQEKERDQEIEREREKAKERQHRERQLERQKEVEREKERDRQRQEKEAEAEREQRDLERKMLELERERERQRKERELDRQREREQEWQRQQKEKELHLERQREVERDRVRERQRRDKEMEQEAQRERERAQRELECEGKLALEKEKEQEREEKGLEREKNREAGRGKEKEKEKDKGKDRHNRRGQENEPWRVREQDIPKQQEERKRENAIDQEEPQKNNMRREPLDRNSHQIVVSEPKDVRKMDMDQNGPERRNEQDHSQRVILYPRHQVEVVDWQESEREPPTITNYAGNLDSNIHHGQIIFPRQSPSHRDPLALSHSANISTVVVEADSPRQINHKRHQPEDVTPSKFMTPLRQDVSPDGTWHGTMPTQDTTPSRATALIPHEESRLFSPTPMAMPVYLPTEGKLSEKTIFQGSYQVGDTESIQRPEIRYRRKIIDRTLDHPSTTNDVLAWEDSTEPTNPSQLIRHPSRITNSTSTQAPLIHRLTSSLEVKVGSPSNPQVETPHIKPLNATTHISYSPSIPTTSFTKHSPSLQRREESVRNAENTHPTNNNNPGIKESPVSALPIRLSPRNMRNKHVEQPEELVTSVEASVNETVSQMPSQSIPDPNRANISASFQLDLPPLTHPVLLMDKMSSSGLDRQLTYDVYRPPEISLDPCLSEPFAVSNQIFPINDSHSHTNIANEYVNNGRVTIPVRAQAPQTTPSHIPPLEDFCLAEKSEGIGNDNNYRQGLLDASLAQPLSPYKEIPSVISSLPQTFQSQSDTPDLSNNLIAETMFGVRKVPVPDAHPTSRQLDGPLVAQSLSSHRPRDVPEWLRTTERGISDKSDHLLNHNTYDSRRLTDATKMSQSGAPALQEIDSSMEHLIIDHADDPTVLTSTSIQQAKTLVETTDPTFQQDILPSKNSVGKQGSLSFSLRDTSSTQILSTHEPSNSVKDFHPASRRSTATSSFVPTHSVNTKDNAQLKSELGRMQTDVRDALIVNNVQLEFKHGSMMPEPERTAPQQALPITAFVYSGESDQDAQLQYRNTKGTSNSNNQSSDIQPKDERFVFQTSITTPAHCNPIKQVSEDTKSVNPSAQSADQDALQSDRQTQGRIGWSISHPTVTDPGQTRNDTAERIKHGLKSPTGLQITDARLRENPNNHALLLSAETRERALDSRTKVSLFEMRDKWRDTSVATPETPSIQEQNSRRDHPWMYGPRVIETSSRTESRDDMTRKDNNQDIPASSDNPALTSPGADQKTVAIHETMKPTQRTTDSFMHSLDDRGLAMKQHSPQLMKLLGEETSLHHGDIKDGSKFLDSPESTLAGVKECLLPTQSSSDQKDTTNTTRADTSIPVIAKAEAVGDSLRRQTGQTIHHQKLAEVLSPWKGDSSPRGIPSARNSEQRVFLSTDRHLQTSSALHEASYHSATSTKPWGNIKNQLASDSIQLHTSVAEQVSSKQSSNSDPLNVHPDTHHLIPYFNTEMTQSHSRDLSMLNATSKSDPPSAHNGMLQTLSVTNNTVATTKAHHRTSSNLATQVHRVAITQESNTLAKKEAEVERSQRLNAGHSRSVSTSTSTQWNLSEVSQHPRTRQETTQRMLQKSTQSRMEYQLSSINPSMANSGTYHQTFPHHKHSASLPSSSVPALSGFVPSSVEHSFRSGRQTPRPSRNPQASTSTIAIPQSGLSSSRDNLHRVPSDETILMTPSSLAPSTLHPSQSHQSIQHPAPLLPDVARKSVSATMSQPKQIQQSSKYAIWHPATFVKEPDQIESRLHLDPQASTRVSTSLHHRINPPPPISIPLSENQDPDSKVFTPFRSYLTSRRKRTMSTVSQEAQDGTAANTVVGSPTTSIHSQTPLNIPAIRDPIIATQEWRNREEAELQAASKIRRQRPGVVFDVGEEPSEEKQRLRRTRTRVSSRQPEGPR